MCIRDRLHTLGIVGLLLGLLNQRIHLRIAVKRTVSGGSEVLGVEQRENTGVRISGLCHQGLGLFQILGIAGDLLAVSRDIDVHDAVGHLASALQDHVDDLLLRCV